MLTLRPRTGGGIILAIRSTSAYGTSSALPACACHMVNNALFTLLTAFGVTIEGIASNAILGTTSLIVFAGCAVIVTRLPD